MPTQIKPGPALQRDLMPQRRQTVRRRAALAVAAVAALAGVALILASGPEKDATPVNEQTETAEDVATSFVAAYGAFDVERASTYLADDADISELVASVGAQGAQRAEGTREELRLLVSLLEAEGYKQTLDSCYETGSLPSGTTVICWFDFHLLRSEQIGLGPYSDSYFDFTVRDGEIVRASQHWEIGTFSPQLWEPFAKWVSSVHPKDAAVMYTDATHSGVRLSQKSIRLWGQRNQEYVDLKVGKDR